MSASTTTVTSSASTAMYSNPAPEQKNGGSTPNSANTTAREANKIFAKDYSSIPRDVKDYFIRHVTARTNPCDVNGPRLIERWNGLSSSQKDLFLQFNKAPIPPTGSPKPWQIGGSFRESDYFKNLFEEFKEHFAGNASEDLIARELWDEMTPSAQARYPST